jgi:nucleoside-diphosphate-sugar epimerase
MKKILITGGCGHIGSHLIKSLEINKYNLVVVDNMLTQRYCSLFNLETPIKFIEKDIKDINYTDLENIDIVIHLAAITNAAGSFNNKEEVEKINYKQTKKFIDTCEQAGCKFIFPSSTSVYGVAADIVYEDEDKFLNPQSPYAESKINIENYLKENISNYLILRFGTIFGISEGMRFHTAINKFCYEASLGRPLTVWKQNYEQYRPYLGLEDAIKVLNKFLEENHWNETYNVLTGNYKLKDIINYISEIMKVNLKMVDTPLLNQFSYKVSDEKIKKIGFEPDEDLRDNIIRTLRTLKNLK